MDCVLSCLTVNHDKKVLSLSPIDCGVQLFNNKPQIHRLVNFKTIVFITSVCHGKFESYKIPFFNYAKNPMTMLDLKSFF